MSVSQGMDRRDFIKVAGGGVLVLVSMGPTTLFAQGRRGYPTDINAYLRIDEDGLVTVFSGKIEMGQGVMTSQAQMAAEELGVALESVEMVLGDTARCPWDAGTFGSLTTRVFGPALRAACAKAREVLLDLAAERLNTPVDRLAVTDGVVRVKGNPARRVTYGELAKGQAITRTVDREAVLLSVREFSKMGTSPKRLDGPDKVTGGARYAGDIRLPGMMYASILRPPAHGATLRNLDTAAAEAAGGVRVVRTGDLIAVLHADPEMSRRALGKVKADWRMPAGQPDTEGIYDHLVANAPRPRVQQDRGDVAAGLAGSAKRFEHTYYNAYVAHAPMEPHTALADFRDGKVTVWSSTQAPFSQQSGIARALGMAQEDVRVITPFVGGGFGGKTSGPQATDAAILSKAAGVPVQVAFTRDEEFFYDSYRPAAVVRVDSGMDEGGGMQAWDYHVYFAGSRGSDTWYATPNVSVRSYGEWGGGGPEAHPFSVGAWRAPGANTNCFAGESQIDIMAAAAGMDPLAFRRKNTADPRMLAVMQAAADAFGWNAATAPSGSGGTGRGMACGIDAGSYVCLMADVTVDESTGQVKVERVVCAQDMGIVVNPDGATMQVEGCITMGLGYVFSEGLRFEGGNILDRNFDTYELPRFSWVPRIETVLVKNDALDPQGGGEPAIVPMGALIANAVFDASGARVFHLPMTPQRVLEAIRSV